MEEKHIPLYSQLKVGQSFKVQLPKGSADSHFIQQLAQDRCIMVVCADPMDARRIHQECQFFSPDLNIQHFPDRETLPYDQFSPPNSLISERISTLNALVENKIHILTVPVTSLLPYLSPPEFIVGHRFSFKVGQSIDRDSLIDRLVFANYQSVPQVVQAGEFAVRGSIIDLFPMGSNTPYRIDFFDQEIDSLRTFDVDTQRSLENLNEIQLLPGKEYPMHEEARAFFRQSFRDYFDTTPTDTLPYQNISKNIAFSGVEYYLPLFFKQCYTLFDYLPKDTLIVSCGALEQKMTQFHHETQHRYRLLKTDPQRPILKPEDLFINQEIVFKSFKNYARIHLCEGHNTTYKKAPDIRIQSRSKTPLEKLSSLINTSTAHYLMCAHSKGRKETLSELFKEHHIYPDTGIYSFQAFLEEKPSFALTVAPIHQGFQWNTKDDQSIILLTEQDLFEQTHHQRRIHRQAKYNQVESMIQDLSELHIGDPVVHIRHGIGRYKGLVSLDTPQGLEEFIHLEYAKESVLYVPIAHLNLLSAYSGVDSENAPLHGLGSQAWDKAQQKAQKKIQDTASHLLAIYAQREAQQGIALEVPLVEYEAFCEGFGFEETPDQAQAIAAVIQDMRQTKPMDRLVCGDVGFGKTEVALRAAFLCAQNGLQVAILCPTTLLAEQHTQTFKDRFADWPIQIAELSRFRSSKEVHKTLKGLEEGTIDIVIGTHKILSEQVKFKQLGLLIIDEEHRFGVRQKETLKAKRAHINVLSLTATPIPRTLSMALEGIRDFSIIASPPQKRLAIKTFIRRDDPGLIHEALSRELQRGGQSYFLHNEISTIENRLAFLQELIPQARIGVAHGQMPGKELERVMRDFYQQKYHILLCSTIIETGIDVPNANTLIIDRADKLGLAQLHQIRGRVGRSHQQAYAYLLTPEPEAISSNAKKRLHAISTMDELGSGFYLAMHDLEIRGTGEILGDAQSGEIQEIGLTLYSKLLNEAVRSLKRSETPNFNQILQPEIDINLHTSACLTPEYCPDIPMRLRFYQRLANAPTLDNIDDLKEEMVDRFGQLPPPAKALIQLHQLRIFAQSIGLKKLDIATEQAVIVCQEKHLLDSLKLIQLVQSNRQVSLTSNNQLKIKLNNTLTLEERIKHVKNLIESLKIQKKN